MMTPEEAASSWWWRVSTTTITTGGLFMMIPSERWRTWFRSWVANLASDSQCLERAHHLENDRETKQTSKRHLIRNRLYSSLSLPSSQWGDFNWTPSHVVAGSRKVSLLVGEIPGRTWSFAASEPDFQYYFVRWGWRILPSPMDLLLRAQWATTKVRTITWLLIILEIHVLSSLRGDNAIPIV